MVDEYMPRYFFLLLLLLPKGRKHCGKTINCPLRAISPSPTVFSKEWYYINVKRFFFAKWLKPVFCLLMSTIGALNLRVDAC